MPATVADDAGEGVVAVGVGGGPAAADGQRQAQQAKQVRSGVAQLLSWSKALLLRDKKI